jgi:hypothetical protein
MAQGYIERFVSLFHKIEETKYLGQHVIVLTKEDVVGAAVRKPFGQRDPEK